ncbi:hypothetical protein BT67DRAFT_266968 [Trichocladium antarcticum]|uniref:Uncharacterized protein n=1 Tax=Trichocladium antarcticum TaxID=1450529 RepID=A0AAN6UBB2_9PEZI|nr:hypothetical protein BT67DRAFT_266968 [Trichocladium antarcticum]
MFTALAESLGISLLDLFDSLGNQSIKMRNTRIVFVAILQFLALGSAQEYQFLKWISPARNSAGNGVSRRQSPPPGYHPEFGSCGTGTTCENACGQNWLSCQASTNLSLFCYNQADLGQTCCENGSGRACERGYYCAWQEFGGKVWCCEDGQSLEECGLPSAASSKSSASSSASESSNSKTTSGTAPLHESSSTSDGESCVEATVTSWGTTTVVSTVSFAVTVTERAEGCTSSLPSGPSGSTSQPGTRTLPPSSSSITKRPPVHNTTSATSIVTGGAGGVRVDCRVMVLVLLGLAQL